MFQVIESIQDRNRFKVDGIMNPGGVLELIHAGAGEKGALGDFRLVPHVPGRGGAGRPL